MIASLILTAVLSAVPLSAASPALSPHSSRLTLLDESLTAPAQARPSFGWTLGGTVVGAIVGFEAGTLVSYLVGPWKDVGSVTTIGACTSLFLGFGGLFVGLAADEGSMAAKISIGAGVLLAIAIPLSAFTAFIVWVIMNAPSTRPRAPGASPREMAPTAPLLSVAL